MDFFLRNLEQAQAQAKLAALNAQKSAKGFAQQVSEQGKFLAEHVTENTRILAEQATSLSKEAAESATHKLRSLETFQPKLGSLGKQAAQPQPSAAELQEFGITDEFLDFVRSLTYSTFREFPADALPHSDKKSEGASSDQIKYLTPWQEHHAMLVVQAAKEINELRYVLCPKRMTDAQFWQIYFQLAKKYFPDEAFDPAYVPAQSITQSMTFADLQTRIAQLSTTAKQWSTQTGASLRSVAASHFGPQGEAPSSTLHEIVATRAASSGSQAASAEPGSSSGQGNASRGGIGAELEADQELEAYLRDVMHSDSKESAAAEGSGKAEPSAAGAAGGATDHFVDAKDSNDNEDDDDDDDFEKYLDELSGSEDGEFVNGQSEKDGNDAGASKGRAEDSGDDLDLDDYMRVLADENKH